MKDCAGYTLLEMVVAIAIFATVILIAGLGLSTVQQSWRRAHTHSERLENMLKVDRVIETSFRNIIPFTWPDKVTKKEIPVFVGEPDKVTFATRHRITATDFSSIRFITMFLENGNLIAEYRRAPILVKEKEFDNIEQEVLAENIESISFKYAIADQTDSIQWLNNWNDEISKNGMPLAIQLTVLWKNERKEVWLRRTAGSGRFESFGKRQKTTQTEINADSASQ